MERSRNLFDRTIAVASLVIALMTLLFTSPILHEHYLSPSLIVKGTRQSSTTLMVEIKNSGRKGAAGIVVEVADRSGGFEGKPIAITKIDVIPPKEFTVVEQGPFRLVKLNSPILQDESVSMYLHTNLADKAWPYVWLRVTSEGKVHDNIKIENL